MAKLKVLERETEIGLQQTLPVVVLESEITDPASFPTAIAELQSPDAKKLAMEAASKHGFQRPAIAMALSVYPVDKDGKVIRHEDPGQIARYRADIQITQARL